MSQHATASAAPTVIVYKSEGNGHVQIVENRKHDQDCPEQIFSRLPQRQPVDMQFENIGFTASLGFRKGKAFYFILAYNSYFQGIHPVVL
jgi:hypothetical protein